jgi:hypothetical protein|tara:strand:+ start:421 stop:546 length:126 start_codon:yes stop_codon:yes gene_type:complete
MPAHFSASLAPVPLKTVAAAPITLSPCATSSPEYHPRKNRP